MITQDDSVAVNEPRAFIRSNDFHRKRLLFRSSCTATILVNSHLLETNRSICSEASEPSQLLRGRFSVYPRQQCYDKLRTERDSFLTDESIPIIHFPWDVVALRAALLPTEIWEIPEDLKISPNMREGNENTTLGETSITSINVFSSKRIFPLVPALFIFYVFSLTKHFFEAPFSDRYVSDN